MKKMPFLAGLFILAVIVLASCQSSVQRPFESNDSEDGFIYGHEATVESLQVLILESFPVQVMVNITGYLPDGCVTLDDISVERSGNEFNLTLNTLRSSGDVECTEALVPFEENVALDVYGLAAGTYTVIAQDQTTSFTLDVDNVPQEPDSGEDTGSNVYLDSITVNMMESFPVQVSVMLTGNLPDGCTKIQKIDSSREDNVFTINITTHKPNGRDACTQLLTPFEETVKLDIQGLSAGEYTVVAGDLTETFVLDTDNIFLEEPAVCPEPQSGETRVEVMFREEGFGFCFLIPEGFNQEKSGPDAEWIINGPNYGAEGSLPIQANLSVRLTFLNGFSMDDYIRQQKSVLDIPASIDQVDGTLGNQLAVIIDGYPIESTSRIVWVGHGTQAYQLIFSPMEPALFPQATTDMEMLYDLVMESWVFLGSN
jgi:inhibitor of cysteine peptidase